MRNVMAVMEVVPIIAGLKAISAPTDGMAIEVLGYHTPGDGGGGLFRWNADSTEPYNGGTVVAKLLDTLDTFTGDGTQTEFTLTHTLQTPESLVVLVDGVDDGGVIYTYHLAGTLLELMQAPEKGVTVRIRRLSPGRWLRVYSGPLNVKWFGAKAVDSKTESTPLEIKENTQAIQTAVNFVKVGATLYFPSGGNYRISSPISLKPCVRYLGEGVASIGDKFLPLGPYGAVLEATNGNAIFTYPSIRDIEIGYLFFCGRRDRGGKALYQTDTTGETATATTATSIIHNCIFYADLEERIYGCLEACDINQNVFGYFGEAGERHRHIYSYGKGNTNFNRITNNTFYKAKGSESIYFEAGYGLTLSGNRFEQNKAEVTIRVHGLFQIHFDDNYFEKNAGDYLIYLGEPSREYRNYIVTATRNYFSPRDPKHPEDQPEDQGVFYAQGREKPIIIFKYNAGGEPAKIFTYKNTNALNIEPITDPDGSGFYPNGFVESFANYSKIKVEHEDIHVNSPWYPPGVWFQIPEDNDDSAKELKSLLYQHSCDSNSKGWQASGKVKDKYYTIFYQQQRDGYGILKVPTTGPSEGSDVFFDHFTVWVRFVNYAADQKPRRFSFAFDVAEAPLNQFPKLFGPESLKHTEYISFGKDAGLIFGIDVPKKYMEPGVKAPFVYLYFTEDIQQGNWVSSNSGAGMTLLAIRPKRRKLLSKITPVTFW